MYICVVNGTVFDLTNTDGSSSCRSEELIDCGNRLILTSQGKRQAINRKQDQRIFSIGNSQLKDKKVSLNKNLQQKYSNFILLPPPVQNQKEVVNVPYDCKGRIDGHWRDTRNIVMYFMLVLLVNKNVHMLVIKLVNDFILMMHHKSMEKN